MDFTDGGTTWNEGDLPDEHEPDPAELAFAAYEDAWKERVRMGITGDSLLIAALVARKVPVSEYAEGTLLRETLFNAWAKGKPSNKLQWVMARYRFRSTIALPGELLSIFKDTTPDWMKVPAPYKKLQNWPQDEDTDSPMSTSSPTPRSMPGCPDGSTPSPTPTSPRTVSGGSPSG